LLLALLFVLPLALADATQLTHMVGLTFSGHVYIGRPPETIQPAAGVLVQLYGSLLSFSDFAPGTLLASANTNAEGVFELAPSPDDFSYDYYHIVNSPAPGSSPAGAQAGPAGTVVDENVVTFESPTTGSYSRIAFWNAPPTQPGPKLETSRQSQQKSSQSSQSSTSTSQSSQQMEVFSQERVGPEPEKKPRLPDTLLIGDFVLHVERYDERALYNLQDDKKLSVGVATLLHWEDLSGTAWLELPCVVEPPLLLKPLLPEGRLLIPRVYEVVPEVADPQLEISLNDAKRFQPEIGTGDRLTLNLQAKEDTPESLLQAKDDLIQGIVSPSEIPDSGIRVRFEAAYVVPVIGEENVGRIQEGRAFYPTEPRQPDRLTVTVDGFTATIEEITLTPEGATARIVLLLPENIAMADSCERARLILEEVTITPDCEFYRENPEDPFGPWIVGDTGLIASGTGYVVDFSPDKSPLGKPLSWKGILLNQGTASGESLIPEPSNTGYLGGRYDFTGAIITSTGLAADLSLSDPHAFQPLQPSGYTITIQTATLQIAESRITGGELGSGMIQCPKQAVIRNGVPEVSVYAGFSTLDIQEDLDIAGEVTFGSGGAKTTVGWGELTHPGEEIVAWKLNLTHGYAYFSAAPNPGFTPDTGTGFLDLLLPITNPDQVIEKLDVNGMSGVTIGKGMSDIEIRSPDRPGGRSNPIKMVGVNGWLRIGARGLDGELRIRGWNTPARIGNVARFGYVGGTPFDALLVPPEQGERPLLLQFADSAVYDSEINGKVNIPEPCKISGLKFSDMEVTSTAHLVGGDVELPVAGVTLEYWDLGFEPTGDPTQAGVVSARTGRLIFTAAGISEDVHFAEAFKLTWCEMLANGNIGELFLDFNDYGQRFDEFPFSPHQLDLSEPQPGKTGLEARAYLAVCGDIRFPQFGSAYVNVKDARHSEAIEPYYNRYVTVPKTGEPGCASTDLTLTGTWDDSLSNELLSLSFPDVTMDYNEVAQLGFIGTGQTDISFLHSDGMEATIDIHPDPILGRPVIDIRFVSDTAHDLDVGLYARLATIGQIAGCIRIDGPLLQRIAVGGYLEQSAATGFAILAPKMAYMVEVSMSVTPSSLKFYAGGDMLVQVAGSAVDVYGSVFLAVDYARNSTEGEIIGRIDCNTVIAGMEGEGQLTWYLDPDEQVLQGKISIGICSWIGGVDLEGGLFLGHNADRDRAWVLYAGSDRFGVPEGFLEERITGIYGYGKLAAGIQLYIFGGGFELYVGMGALFPTAEAPLPSFLGSGGLYVHGEILGGLVSASAWATLDLRLPAPFYFEGEFGLEGCVLWVICASIDVTAGFDSGGFYIYR
jgi:hypothetical protein